jgi:hypothetical protein
MSDWPTTTEQSEQTFESTYGNQVTVTQTTWPAGVITLTSEPPEPPGGRG